MPEFVDWIFIGFLIGALGTLLGIGMSYRR